MGIAIEHYDTQIRDIGGPIKRAAKKPGHRVPEEIPAPKVMPEAATPLESFNPTEFGVRFDTKKKHEALPFWRASSRRAGFEGRR